MSCHATHRCLATSPPRAAGMKGVVWSALLEVSAWLAGSRASNAEMLPGPAQLAGAPGTLISFIRVSLLWFDLCAQHTFTFQLAAAWPPAGCRGSSQSTTV